jgi:hypothetical protein
MITPGISIDSVMIFFNASNVEENIHKDNLYSNELDNLLFNEFFMMFQSTIMSPGITQKLVYLH